MPTYVYRCQQCGSTLERRQGFNDAPLTACDVCSGELRRVLQPVSVIFRGSGFYSTDNKNSSGPARTDGNGSASDDGEEKKATGTATIEPPASAVASDGKTTSSDGKAVSSAPSSSAD